MGKTTSSDKHEARRLRRELQELDRLRAVAVRDEADGSMLAPYAIQYIDNRKKNLSHDYAKLMASIRASR